MRTDLPLRAEGVHNVGHPIEVLTTAPAAAPAVHVEHASQTQAVLAAVLADVLQVEQVPVDAHVFDDLGADSMVMARFCARLRKQPALPTVSMKDVYQHPTIHSLAAAVTADVPATAKQSVPVPTAPPPPAPADTAPYLLCGTLQALFFIGYCLLVAAVSVAGYGWISDGQGLVGLYARSVVIGGAAFVGLTLLPILVKWVLIGRGKPQQFPVWSLGYVRLRIVKKLIQRNPMLLFFSGTPLYVWYLRALGAKVGRDVAIFVRQVPVATGPLASGAGAGGRPARSWLRPAGAGGHRPGDDRRRDGDPEGRLDQRLPGPRRADPNRPDHSRQGRGRGRGLGERYRDVGGRR